MYTVKVLVWVGFNLIVHCYHYAFVCLALTAGFCLCISDLNPMFLWISVATVGERCVFCGSCEMLLFVQLFVIFIREQDAKHSGQKRVTWSLGHCLLRLKQTIRQCDQQTSISNALCGAYKPFAHLWPLVCTHLWTPLFLKHVSCALGAPSPWGVHLTWRTSAIAQAIVKSSSYR